MSCGICGAWPDSMHHDESTNSSATNDRFPKEVDQLVRVRATPNSRSETKRCPECGTYYELDNFYEYTPLGNDDDFFLTRLTYMFPATPKREERKRIDTMISGITDPIAAWAVITKKWEMPGRWSYLEEQFEVCESCGGSATDPYAGACYACTHNGRNLTGYRPSPTPPTMKHVIAFGSDIWGMRRVDAAVQTLFGTQPPIEWVLAAGEHYDRSMIIPAFLKPALKELREALHDETIPVDGVHAGWFERCANAWNAAWAKKIEPIASRLDPFELLAGIMRAGYRIEVNGQVVRVFCAE